ncbi:MAG: hypothetical protein ACU0DH_06220, partial [Paracoccus sp. (in: a-proteobacteria)]
MTIWNQMRVLLTRLGLIMAFLASPIQAQNISDNVVRLVGRFHGLPNEITAEWPGSLIEIRFEGARLDVTISDSGNNRLIVEIDGKPRPLEMKSGKHTYSVLDD